MDTKISSLTETQYSQLCEEARHYTHQTWLAPSTALTFKGVLDILRTFSADPGGLRKKH